MRIATARARRKTRRICETPPTRPLPVGPRARHNRPRPAAIHASDRRGGQTRGADARSRRGGFQLMLSHQVPVDACRAIQTRGADRWSRHPVQTPGAGASRKGERSSPRQGPRQHRTARVGVAYPVDAKRAVSSHRISRSRKTPQARGTDRTEPPIPSRDVEQEVARRSRDAQAVNPSRGRSGGRSSGMSDGMFSDAGATKPAHHPRADAH